MTDTPPPPSRSTAAADLITGLGVLAVLTVIGVKADWWWALGAAGLVWIWVGFVMHRNDQGRPTP